MIFSEDMLNNNKVKLIKASSKYTSVESYFLIRGTNSFSIKNDNEDYTVFNNFLKTTILCIEVDEKDIILYDDRLNVCERCYTYESFEDRRCVELNIYSRPGISVSCEVLGEIDDDSAKILVELNR